MSQPPIDYRFAALWRFGLAITVLNMLGHTVLGFEQAWALPLAALATTYTLEILLEVIDARVAPSAGTRRPLRFAGGWRPFLSFILPAHITALAIAMLLYPNARIWPVVFAAAVAIGSKALFRVPTTRGSRHFFNPSNFGITVTLIAFPYVGIAPPYHFTENLSGWGDWLLPSIIILSGSFLNVKLTRKSPLILGWLGGFVVQALFRSLVFGNSFVASLLPMTGLAFLLYTFYMVTDPATTPIASSAQVIFGASVALVYGVLMYFHIVFGLFFALTAVSIVRGVYLATQSALATDANWAPFRQIQTFLLPMQLDKIRMLWIRNRAH